MTLDDVVKLILKCWLAKEHDMKLTSMHICCAYYEALDTANYSSNEISIANFTEPATNKLVLVVHGQTRHIIL
jgi:hypothetical protein